DVIQPPYAHMRGAPSTSSGGWVGFPMAIGQGLPGGAIARRFPRAAAPTGIRASLSPAVLATNIQASARLIPGSRPPGWPGVIEEDEVLSILGIGGGLADRLVATVIASWSERIDADDFGTHRAALGAALFGRVTLALRAWLADPNLEVEVEMIGPRQEAQLSRSEDTITITARLPFRWLSDIWARGLAVVLGRFSLALTESSDDRQRVVTASTDLLDFRPVTISLGAAT
ncbi:MAG: hypothetical protein ACRD6W_14630, partial [Nitrososphaerales archaeon]